MLWLLLNEIYLTHRAISFTLKWKNEVVNRWRSRLNCTNEFSHTVLVYLIPGNSNSIPKWREFGKIGVRWRKRWKQTSTSQTSLDEIIELHTRTENSFWATAFATVRCVLFATFHPAGGRWIWPGGVGKRQKVPLIGQMRQDANKRKNAGNFNNFQDHIRRPNRTCK